MTKIFSLPNDLGLNDSNCAIYQYQNNVASVNNKVIFKQNLICILLEGNKIVNTRTETFSINDQHLFLLSAGSVLMTEQLSVNKNYKAILIFFDHQILIDVCKELSITICKEQPSKQMVLLNKDPFIDLFAESVELLQIQNVALQTIKVKEILTYLTIQYQQEMFAFLNAECISINDIQFKQTIELNRDKDLTLDELAFLCNMSLATFKRKFTGLYKVSPHKYFTKHKMERAKKLLLLHKKPSEIYSEIGYANLSAFSAEFKKHFGISPSTIAS